MANIVKILGHMTLRQKLAQLTQLEAGVLTGGQSAVTGPLMGCPPGPEDLGAVGSVLNAFEPGVVRQLQRRHMESDPNGIPLLFMLDVIHGYHTIFPIPLALGCSWEPELAERVARASAFEAYHAGVHVAFSPMADLVRDARWGRVMESSGEDPHINGLMAAAFVRGLQGDNLCAPGSVAACVKHIAGYGAVEAGREYNTVDIGEHMLREYYLPAYRSAVQAGCAMAMTAFTTLDGIPATAHTRLLRGILRGEWGFEGPIISDYGAVHELISHGVAQDGAEAARKALLAGVDIDMMAGDYLTWGEKLVRDGLLKEATVDEAVLRLLRLKEDLGLFDDPYRGVGPDGPDGPHYAPAARETALEAAAKSMILLKNNGILPCAKHSRLAVIGPFARAQSLLGNWACHGNEQDVVTLEEGLLESGAEQAVFVETPLTEAADRETLRGALDAAREAELVILALGEHPRMSGEAASRTDIRLPACQRRLFEQVRELGKPVAVVLFNGRPLDLTGLQTADAILEAWFPGVEGGRAAAQILLGERSPEGRLSMSFPRCVGQLPLYYNRLNTGRPRRGPFGAEKYVSAYIDEENAPLYPFGFGLTYTAFTYGGVRCGGDRLFPGECLPVSIRVTNTGERTGTETVQLYIRDVSASVSRPFLELKGFVKLTLGAGESGEASFAITENMLKFHTADGEYRAEPGLFEVYIGGDASVGRKASFRLMEPLSE